MKISYNWLFEYIDISHKPTPDQVAELLTHCGLEVEGIELFETVKGGLKGFVVGEVKSCIKHPKADKLSVTTVDVGTGTDLTIVCGAPNVAEGQKVPVALIGTTLYSGNSSFEITKRALRGIESEGMICAEDELGIGTSHDGIMILAPTATIGTPLSSYFNIQSDAVFEIGLTPNRSDATSHIGVARDLVAVLNHSPEFKHHQAKLIKPSVDDFKVEKQHQTIQIVIEDPAVCTRYTGLSIDNITITDSPDWLKQKLNSIGLRPINNLVDITNFILMETGQPLHAFDLAAIKGNKVIIKNLPNETPFVTLDGQERKLSSEDLMICNADEAMCIAGVFGGLHSGITTESKAVFLESAHFNAQSIRRTSKRHGLKTDASFRFERGADPEITVYAIKRAAHLIKELCGGIISSEVVDVYSKPILPCLVDITFHQINTLIGKEIEKEVVKSILTALGIKITNETATALTLEVPTFKTDVTRPADIIEEILRIYGYNNIELPETIRVSTSESIFSQKEHIVQQLSNYLTANAFYEIMNNSLTHSDHIAQLPLQAENNVPILNPLSRELNVMRRTLLNGGLETIVYNQNRKATNLKLYEFGKAYHFNPETTKGDDVTKRYFENFRLSIYLTGQMNEESWYKKEEKSSFFDLKYFVHSIMKRCGIEPYHLISNTASDAPFSESLTYFYEDKKVVEFGQLSKGILKSYDIKQDVFFAEFDFDLMLELASKHKTKFIELPKFPEVRRDLALLIDKSVQFEHIRKIAFNIDNTLLHSVNLFDVYEGDKLPEGKKSYAVSFMLRDDSKTLNDAEIDAVMDKLIKAYIEQIGAVIR